MIGHDEQVGRRREACIRVGEQPWVHVTVRADQRQVSDARVQLTREAALSGVGIEAPIRGQGPGRACRSSRGHGVVTEANGFRCRAKWSSRIAAYTSGWVRSAV